MDPRRCRGPRAQEYIYLLVPMLYLGPQKFYHLHRPLPARALQHMVLVHSEQE